MSIIHDPHDYEHVCCSVIKVREGTVFLVLSPANCDDFFISLGHIMLLIRARYIGGPQAEQNLSISKTYQSVSP